VRVAAPADKRFRRSHVRPSRRRAPGVGRALTAARVLAAVAVIGGAGWYGVQAVAGAGALHVSDIRVRGHHHLARGDVMALLAGLEGQHLLHADLEAWRRRLLASPWVEHAELRRVLPSTVEISLRERTPMAIGRIRGDLYLVDEQGGVIDEYGPNYAQFDLPVVDGLADGPRGGHVEVHPDRAALAAAFLQSVAARPALLRRVSQIDVTQPHDAVVLLEEDATLLHLGHQQFVERMERYLELRDALRARVPEMEYVDLRFDDRVYVRPVKGTDVQRSGGAPR
jgi:cell division septal protein FtsQ